jgi:hypothetical protein
MKAKTTLVLTAIGLTLACSQVASASVLLLGWHVFDATANGEAPDYSIPGISGFLYEGAPSWDVGGSNDGGYGDSPFPTAQNPPEGDGHARLRARTPVTDGFLQIAITNSGSSPFILESLLFDMAAPLENALVSIFYGSTWGVPPSGPNGDLLGIATTGGSQGSGEYDDYDDFSVVLDRQLAAGETSYITFWAESSFALSLDNIGVSARLADANAAPVFISDPIAGAEATEGAPYSGTLAGTATDPDAGDTLDYAKVSGPEWLTVDPDGTLGGTPFNADVGPNTFTVSVTDSEGATATATLNITVVSASASPIIVAAFYDFGGTDNPEDYPPPNYLAPGFSGGVTKGKPSWDIGGSNDGTLGDVPFADSHFESPSADGDGHLRIAMNSANEGAVLRVSNSSGVPWSLDELHFDAAGSNISGRIEVFWSFDSVFWAPLGSSPPTVPFANSGFLEDYGDYRVSLGGFTLGHGASIFFQFTTVTSATAYIDNIGLTGWEANPNPDANDNGILDIWEIAKFGNADPGSNPPDADPDGDGLSNLMEFALDTNPLVRNASPLVYDFHTLADGKHLRLTVQKNPGATNLEYLVETCGALNDWSTTNTFIESVNTAQLIVRDTLTTATAPRRFIHLKVQVKP